MMSLVYYNTNGITVILTELVKKKKGYKGTQCSYVQIVTNVPCTYCNAEILGPCDTKIINI